MSIRCDFCGETVNFGVDNFSYLTSAKNKHIHICSNCLDVGSKIISERKNNSEAPTARTDEASDLSGTKE